MNLTQIHLNVKDDKQDNEPDPGSEPQHPTNEAQNKNPTKIKNESHQRITISWTGPARCAARTGGLLALLTAGRCAPC